VIFANKGILKKVDAGGKCNKTKGPFLIEIAKQVPSILAPDSQRKRENLQLLGQHLVWDSFSKKLVQLAAMMILSKHVPSLERLKNYQFGECPLEYSSFFSLVTGDLADLDGSYGVADGGRRYLMRRFGDAEVGMSNGSAAFCEQSFVD
jgi:hypothetical protein